MGSTFHHKGKMHRILLHLKIQIYKIFWERILFPKIMQIKDNKQ
jgi:hypothetical protein